MALFHVHQNKKKAERLVKRADKCETHLIIARSGGGRIKGFQADQRELFLGILSSSLMISIDVIPQFLSAVVY